MNWGTKLIIGMLIFMSFIMVLAIKMMRSDTDALVEENYYEKGLKYDEIYTLKAQVFKDSALPVISVGDTVLTVLFTREAEGKIKLMRTSDQLMDRSVPFNTTEVLSIPLDEITSGQWKLIIDWKNKAGKRYLYEEEVKIP